MPELPEVETVRRGLARRLRGKRIETFEIHSQAANRQSSDRPLSSVRGATIIDIRRRGKFLWFVLNRDFALMGHLGMSGQMVLSPKTAPLQKHMRIRMDYGDRKRDFRFIDQRTFGWMAIDNLVPSDEGEIPRSFLRIARDPFDPRFDRDGTIARIRKSRSEIKRVLLDQKIISGIGNIYADEALWLAKVHPQTLAFQLSDAQLRSILASVVKVMERAIAKGGTSFDDLYIDVNGESGYFEISLNAYGKEGDPCRRCRTPIRRIAFANRSSHFCPKCQVKSRRKGGQ